MINPRAEFMFSDLQVDSQVDSIQIRWQVPADLSYFNGHFPQKPILPAVAMIDASVEVLRKALNLNELKLRSIRSSKFMHPVTPHLLVDILLRKNAEREWQVEWRTAGEQVISIAQLLFLF